MLRVRANVRPLFFLRTPHIYWTKWPRICSNSKHSWDTVEKKIAEIFWIRGHFSYISAILWVWANPRPLRPTNVGVLRKQSGLGFALTQSIKKLQCGGGGWNPQKSDGKSRKRAILYILDNPWNNPLTSSSKFKLVCHIANAKKPKTSRVTYPLYKEVIEFYYWHEKTQNIVLYKLHIYVESLFDIFQGLLTPKDGPFPGFSVTLLSVPPPPPPL